MEVVANQNRMRGGEARAERNSRSGGRLSYPTVWWSGGCAVTEFVVERTTSFHITTRFTRAASFVLEIGASLVQYRHKTFHTRRLYVIKSHTWWLWCSGSTRACGALSLGSTPSSHPNKFGLVNCFVVQY